jgi:hypothetical protein
VAASINNRDKTILVAGATGRQGGGVIRHMLPAGWKLRALILVNVARFRHKMGPSVQEWLVKNISTRYSTAGVRRFACRLPESVPIPHDEPVFGFSDAGFQQLRSGDSLADGNRLMSLTSWIAMPRDALTSFVFKACGAGLRDFARRDAQRKKSTEGREYGRYENVH